MLCGALTIARTVDQNGLGVNCEFHFSSMKVELTNKVQGIRVRKAQKFGSATALVAF